VDAKTGLKNSLLAAASEGNTPLGRVLLKQGADLEANNEKKGMTPLMYAAGEGHLDLVRMLLSKGADVNAKTWMTFRF